MNRYMEQGILNDLREGKFVVLVSHQTRVSEFNFKHMAHLLEGGPGVKKIRRAHGQEEVEMTNGGRLKFISTAKGAGRGFNADVVVIIQRDLMDYEKITEVLDYARTTNAEAIPA